MGDFLSIQFGVYVALAFVLYAIRRAIKLPKRYLPLLAIVLGIVFSWIQGDSNGYHIILRGIEYALYGVGTIETIRYTFTKHGNEDKGK